MELQGLTYLLFLIAALAAFRWAPASWRRFLLLAASYAFYISWSPAFLGLLLAASLFTFWWSRVLSRRREPMLLWIGLVANLAPLVAFKYFSALLAAFLPIAQDSPGVLAPLGISFYTFQAVSYLMDVYRGNDQKPGWVDVCLYMAFWPTILSGPICRLPEMLPQFRNLRPGRPGDLSLGLRRIILGLFMKTVVADTLLHGVLPDQGLAAGFAMAGGWSACDVWILAIGSGMQIFFDFAGYSHLVIGSARLFGLRLRENFQDPYGSTSVTAFWTRWHMSLSSWIRDYLFFPLAAAGRSTAWRVISLVVSMAVFGIWHGAGLPFLLWGIFHGLLLAGHRMIQRLLRRRTLFVLPRPLQAALSWALTFLLVNLGWLLFQSADLGQAGRLLGALVDFGRPGQLSGELYLLVSAVTAALLLSILMKSRFKALGRRSWIQQIIWLGLPLYHFVLILLIVVWSDRSSPFVYVRF